MRLRRSLSGRSEAKPLLLVGPTSGWATTGLSVAFEMLIQALVERSIPHVVIDAAATGKHHGGGSFTLRRAAAVFTLIARVVSRLRRHDTLYMTMSGSVLGFYRDVVIVHFASAFGVRTILHFHGGGYDELYSRVGPMTQAAMRHTLRKVDTIIVLGELLRDQFAFLEAGERPRIVVVNNGLPEDPEPFVGRRCREPGRVRLLYLSNMIPSKGYLKVLEATRLLKEMGWEVECHFAGEFLSVGRGPDALDAAVARKEFLDRVAAWELGRAVTFHGTVGGTEKRWLLEHADIFVLPTEYPGEGQPISIIEALSRGMPVIAPDYRGIPEQVTSGVNGCLLLSVTPEAIADAVVKIAGDPEVYRRLSKEARKTYEERFTKKRHIDSLLSVVLQG